MECLTSSRVTVLKPSLNLFGDFLEISAARGKASLAYDRTRRAKPRGARPVENWNPTSIASVRRRRPSPYERNAAISRHFERDLIPYALETDWPVGAAGFEPLHLEIRSAELDPASTGFRRRSGAPLIRDAQVQVPPPGLRVLANSDSNMQRFESRRPRLEALRISIPECRGSNSA